MDRGKLYIIATPIGNLEDISARALRILSEVDLIVCEDTRVTKKLLSHYAIATPTESYHAQSSRAKENKLLSLLRDRKHLALVSDSGTPTISDPGCRLISRAHEFPEEISLIAIPGPSAVIAALSLSGFSASNFLFLGFLPHKKGRETLFNEIAQAKYTVVFYESPHRILKTLASLQDHLDDTRALVVARELTKVYEEVKRGNAREILTYFSENPEKVRGEFVVVVGPTPSLENRSK
ncbi:MAG: 16S rRNA (cytidine(1402)-2'-O)-methyltransferase [Candidatus Paceibacterota bacterium]